MRIITALLGLFLAVPALAQNHFTSTSGDVSLTAQTYAVTLQQSANAAGTGGKEVTLESATVYCSAAATVTHTKNSVAATATAGTVVAQPGNTSAAATATFWTASNVSGGTALRVDHIPAGGTFTYTFSPDFRLAMNGTGSNYTISIASITATCNISVSHAEPK
jgi:hypothetical protein